jgi:hypothetical protein
MEISTKQIHYLRACRRRWGFQYGLTCVAVKEYISRENRKPDLSFIVELNTECTLKEIERCVRAEILKRIRS